MKKLFILLSFIVLSFSGCISEKEGSLPYPSLHGQITYFQEKDMLYGTFPINNQDIVLIGDDLFDRGEWHLFYGDERVKNRGIALEGTECTLYRLHSIVSKKPSKIFINTGYFDVRSGRGADSTANAILNIVKRAKKISPSSELYVVGLLPDRRMESLERGDTIVKINNILENNRGKLYTYIDIASVLCSEDGFLSPKYSFNGINLNGAGYQEFASILSPYIGIKPQNRACDKTYPGKSGHYLHRVSIFNSLPNSSGKVLMLGNSLNNNVRWEEFFPGTGIVNRGISGDTMEGLLMRMEDVIEENPSKIFLMIGINNFINDTTQSVASVWFSYDQVIEKIGKSLPGTELYIFSTLPLNPKTPYYQGRNKKVYQLNELIKSNSQNYNYTYLDLASLLKDNNSDLDIKYTCDGIHLLPDGYLVWKEMISDHL